MVRQQHTTATSASASAAATTATASTSLLLTPPKRKKGRPSLHDLQQRKLFQQQLRQQQQQQRRQLSNPNHKIKDDQNPNSLPRRIRSSRRTSTVPAQFLLGSDSDSDSPPSPHSHSRSDSDSDSGDERAAKKVRRIPSSSSNKTPKIELAFTQDEKGSKATDTHNGTRILSGPTNASTSAAAAASATALPDRKLLLLVLDKLQKKDTRGVFAEPVDPEELPDYHEVIENPMDFGTVKSNLDRGRYKSLEQLEDDIYLISSNAMQYNPPSSIFFRQARSIQELAKKEFDILRQDAGLSEPPPKPRRGRPPGSKNMKKLLESSPADQGVSESPSDGIISREEDAPRPGSYNLRKGPSLYRFPRNLENCYDFSVSSSRYMSTKYSKKPCGSEENRRDTYGLSLQIHSDQDSFAPFEGSQGRLNVAAASTYGYARSLARFAEDLGPVVWRIVSKKLRSVLPPGVDFGPGWVDENQTSSTQLSPVPEKLVQSSYSLQDSFISKAHSPLTPGFTNSTVATKLSSPCSENSAEAREVNCSSDWSSLNGVNGVMRPDPLLQSDTGPVIHPRMNGFSFGSSSQFQEALGGPSSSSFLNPSQFPKPNAFVPSSFGASTSAALSNMNSPPVDYHGMMNTQTDMGAQGTLFWQNLSMQERWDRPYSAELNGNFQASSSRNSGLPIGSPPQLDLVLQL